MMKFLPMQLNFLARKHFLKKVTSQIFDMVLNMPINTMIVLAIAIQMTIQHFLAQKLK